MLSRRPLSELASLVRDLESAVQILEDEIAAQGMPELSLSSSESHPIDSPDYLPSPAIYEARRIILGCAGQIKCLVESPLQAVATSLFMSTEAAAVRLVAELGIPDMLAAAQDPDIGLTVAELAARADVDPVKLEMGMRLLVNQGWIRESKTGYFVNNRRGRLLCKGLPTYHAATSINEMMHKISEKIPAQIGHPEKEFRYSLQPNHAAFNLALKTDLPFFGAAGWLASHSDDAQAFTEFMSVISTIGENAVVLDFPWAQVAHGKNGIVDVGGGRGTLCCCLAENVPEIGELIVQDLPMARANAEEYISAKGLSSRVEFEEHDFFKPQPRKAMGDYVYVLQNVLHDWSPEDCVKILGQLRDSLQVTENNTLLVITSILASGVLSERNTPVLASLQELRETATYKSIVPPSFVPEDYGEANRYPQGLNLCLVGLCNGASRTLLQWTEIFEQAGLRVCNVYATRSWMSVIELGLIPS